MADMSYRQYRLLIFSVKCQKHVLLWHLWCECSLWGWCNYFCPLGYLRHPHSSKIQFITVITLNSLHFHRFVLNSAGLSFDLSGNTNRLFRTITQWSTPGWSSCFNQGSSPMVHQRCSHAVQPRVCWELFTPAFNERCSGPRHIHLSPLQAP